MTEAPSTLSCFLCGERRFSLISDRARFGMPSKFWLCEGCGLIHQDPESGGNWKTERYASGEYRESNAPESPDRLHAGRRRLGEERAAWLDSRLRGRTGSPRVLEIGSAEGAFLAAGRSRGWSVEGIEPDPLLSAFTRDRLAIPTFSGGWQGYVVQDRFDAVVSFHVIEHLPDAPAFLRFVRGLLKDGGLFGVETPDNLRPWTPRGRWTDWFDQGHLSTYHEPGLGLLLQRAGFERLVQDAGCLDLRLMAEAGAPRETAPAMGDLAGQVRTAFHDFRRHHWWKRWARRVARVLRPGRTP
jgi:SAM-dependent methyltransferase